MPAALATITVLRPGTRRDEQGFELFVVSTDEELPKAAAYIAAASIDELAGIVLALTDVSARAAVRPFRSGLPS